MDLSAIPTVCAICKHVVPFGSTIISTQPILRAEEDGSPKPAYHGMATQVEFRVCDSH